jgi:hypothetical protein
MTCEKFDTTGTYEGYLAGKLSEPERDAFEQHYFACDRCFEALRLLRATRDALRAGGAQAPPAKPVPFPGFRRRGVWAAVGLAAAILAGVVVMPTIRHSPPAPPRTARVSAPAPLPPDIQLLARMDPPAYDPQTLRGAESASASRFHDAMAPYAAGDFSTAKDALRKVLDADPSSLDARYFLGICHLLTGGLEPGIAELRQVIDAGSASPYVEEAHFYLAKAYLKQGKVREARERLEKVAAQTGDLSQPASEILNRLPLQ